MKIRTDFVSNSSSSSFIVISDSGNKCNYKKAREYGKHHMLYSIPNKNHGCLEFGWQDEAYETLEDKLNWCGIILLDLYAACRNADFQAAWTKKTSEQICAQYNDWHKKYIKWYKMLENVCKERFGIGIYLDLSWLKLYGATGLDDKYVYVSTSGCSIDHQSNIFEEPANGKMFESEETLYNFLAYENSYIQCGNDNG